MSDRPPKDVPVVKDNPVPPIDDTITVKRPPATGEWCLCAVDGVVATDWAPK